MSFLLLIALACNGRDPSVTDSADTDLPQDSGDTECVPLAVAEDCATEADDDCDGLADAIDALNCTNFYRDSDGDGAGDADDALCACVAPSGFVASSDDCDDSNNAVWPTAVESCNEIDDDCDGEVDPVDAEGCTVFFADTDGDGAGDATVEVCACELPEAYVTNTDDCDDSTSAVGPSEAESCNDVDDDCDGVVDPIDSVGCTEVWADTDGDGFGGAESVCACGLPDGYADSSDDCNDDNDAVSPAATESCNTIDDDCDEVVDPLSSEGCTQVYRDFDEDGFGDATRTFCECDGRDGYVADDTDCDDLDAAVNTAATEVCNTIDDDCSGSADDDAVDKRDFFADGDGDGYAAPGAQQAVACSAPDGFSAGTGDCDDTDPERSPGLEERCDNVDNDCDDSTAEAGVVSVYDGLGNWSGDALTLADAVVLAEAGSEIVFCSGSYEGGLSLGLSGFDLTLRGLNGPEVTELVAPTNESVIHHEAGALVVEGLTLTGADLSWGRGGGLNATMANTDSVTLRNVAVHGNHAQYGGGINISGGVAELDGVDVWGNSVEEGGGGAMISNATLTFTNLTLRDNSAFTYGGLWLTGGSATGTGWWVRGNTSGLLVSGAYVGSGAFLEVEDFAIAENSGDGGGLMVGGGADVVLRNGAVVDNTSSGFGGGIYVLDGSLEVESTEFERNVGTLGGGIYRSNFDATELFIRSCGFGGVGDNDNTPDDVAVGSTPYEFADGVSADCPAKQQCSVR